MTFDLLGLGQINCLVTLSIFFFLAWLRNICSILWARRLETNPSVFRWCYITNGGRGADWGEISCKVKLIPNLEISPWDGIKTSPCEMHSAGLRNTNPGSNKAFWILFMTGPPFISDVSCKTQHNGKWLSVPFPLNSAAVRCYQEWWFILIFLSVFQFSLKLLIR